MIKIFKYLSKIFIVVILIFFASKPYNRHCIKSGKCSPLYISDLIPRINGNEEFDVKFVITNYREDVILYPKIDKISTVTGKKNIVTFIAKNNSNKKIDFKTKMFIEPSFLKGEIKSYECLCGKKFSLKKDQEFEIKSIFRFKKDVLEKYKYGSLENYERMKSYTTKNTQNNTKTNTPKKQITIRFKVE